MTSTKISLSDISEQLRLHLIKVQALRGMATRYVEALVSDVIEGNEPVVRNAYSLRNATIIETQIDSAFKELKSAALYTNTFQRKEQKDAD